MILGCLIFAALASLFGGIAWKSKDPTERMLASLACVLFIVGTLALAGVFRK
jgi:formate hydrogenlyase subunit 3/multisubunit Na+/H+ antiporter MnhD subunit